MNPAQQALSTSGGAILNIQERVCISEEDNKQLNNALAFSGVTGGLLSLPFLAAIPSVLTIPSFVTTAWNALNAIDDLATTAQCLAGDEFACSMTIPAYLNPIPGMTLVDDIRDLLQSSSFKNLIITKPSASGELFGDSALLSAIGGGTYKAGGGDRLIIDPKNDVGLQNFLQKAEQYVDTKRMLDPSISRADLLNELVNQSLRYATPGELANSATILREELYSGGVAKLGDFLDCRSGVCREYAAVLHVALADSGKPNYMTTGTLTGMDGEVLKKPEKHAWIEYIDTITGEWMVADPTNGFVLPRSQAYAQEYLEVTDISQYIYVWPQGTPITQRLLKKVTTP